MAPNLRRHLDKDSPSPRMDTRKRNIGGAAAVPPLCVYILTCACHSRRIFGGTGNVQSPGTHGWIFVVSVNVLSHDFGTYDGQVLGKYRAQAAHRECTLDRPCMPGAEYYNITIKQRLHFH